MMARPPPAEFVRPMAMFRFVPHDYNPGMLSLLLGALLIFLLRVTDVSIGSMRVIYMVRGQRLVAALLGFLESGIFIIAISQVLRPPLEWPKMIGYAAGFAVGTALGVTIERWIASGYLVARIISREKFDQLRERLVGAGFGVTAISAEGREGHRQILFVVCQRRRGDELLKIVQELDPRAFVTIDPVSRAIGGYIPHVASAASVRK
jgi:uncharacterized protein YebE (UPF0316 family)